MMKCSCDDQLTNLNWLVKPLSVSNLSLLPTPPTTPVKRTIDDNNIDHYCIKSPSPHHRFSNGNDQLDYKTERVKPAFSYAQLIVMAMKAHNCEKIVLTDIYEWIRDNFAYYRYGDTSWQNSIRHNLSLHKQFIKVPRDPDDKGKGSYWKLDQKRKDPYCLRSRNFLVDAGVKKAKPLMSKPQVNPAIKSLFDKWRSSSNPTMTTTPLKLRMPDDDHHAIHDHHRSSEVQFDCIYVPQNEDARAAVVLSTTSNNSSIDDDDDNNNNNNDRRQFERVTVEYNWEGYEYQPIGVQLPLQLSPSAAPSSIVTIGSLGFSPSNFEDIEFRHHSSTESTMSNNCGLIDIFQL